MQNEDYKEFIGDGVYAEFDGNGIKLSTHDDFRETNNIYLDTLTLGNLVEFLKRVRKNILQ